MVFLGMNPDAMTVAAAHLMRIRASLELASVELPATLEAVDYRSPDLSALQKRLSDLYLPTLAGLSLELMELAHKMRLDAEAQRAQSAGS